jgi:hypothetical protein
VREENLPRSERRLSSRTRFMGLAERYAIGR